MAADLLDQLHSLAAHLDGAVAPVTVDELRPIERPIEIDIEPDEVSTRRYGRLLAIAAAVAIVVAAVVVFAGRHSPTTPSIPPVASGTTIAPATSPVPSASTTTTPSTASQPAVIGIPAGGITMAFGGSVMLGAAQELTGVGVLTVTPGFTPGGFGISRSDQAAIAKAAEADTALSPIMILQIGEDGPIEQTDYEHLLMKLANQVRVLVLTVHGDGQWFAPNNAFIRSLPARFPNVTVVDWDEAVTSGEVTGILPDGMHLGVPARTAYAALVGKALVRAQHEAPPPTTTTSTTTPPADGACQWTAADTGGDGAGGHLASYITLRNVGTHTCALPKVTGATVSWTSASATVRATPGSFFPEVPGPATVAPGVRVTLTLTTTTIADCSAVRASNTSARVEVRLSDGSTLHVDLQYYPNEKCGVGYSQLGPANQ